MERENNQALKGFRPWLPVVLIVLFHMVGLAGFLTPALSGFFITLVPWHLLLMFIIILVSTPYSNPRFAIFFLVIYTAGFLIELLGIHTGAIFGSYSYGRTLGLKIAGTPLMIGINWVLVIYSAGMCFRKLINRRPFAGIIGGALLVTLLDSLIEPVAVRFDYWQWNSELIPVQNYIAWFVFSCLLLCFFYRMQFKKHHPAAVALFITQFIFFLVLNLYVRTSAS